MNKWSVLIAGVAIFTLSTLSNAEAPVKIKVLKNNVNLRAKSSLSAEVAAQASKNDQLDAKNLGNEWVEIVPPDYVDLWIYEDYVENNVIKCVDQVNVRAGPGINFSIVGKLTNGDKVNVRGKHTDWVKIVPPNKCSLWVARFLVEVVPEKKTKPKKRVSPKPATIQPWVKEKPVQTKLVKKTPIKPTVQKPGSTAYHPQRLKTEPIMVKTKQTNVTSAVRKSVSAEKRSTIIPPPPDLDLIPSVGQGQWKQYEGTLRPRIFIARSPSRYRLVKYDNEHKATTICWVKGNRAQLKALLNRRMVISGREYWVRKRKYSVLVPERIILK